jgi:hypothetical protein
MTSVPPGRHENWCRCQGCRDDIARFESQQFKGTMIAAGVVIAIGLLIWVITAVVHAL